MKILFISPHKSFGGASTANLSIANMLSINNEVTYMDEFLPTVIQKKYNKINFSKFKLHENKNKLFKTFKYINRNKPQIIYLGIPFISIYLWPILLLFRIKGIKITFIFHSLSINSKFISKLYDNIISLTSLIATSLVFVSDYTRNSWNKYLLIRLRKSVCHVIRNSVEIHSNVERQNFVSSIGFVGRLSDEKNPILFIKIALSNKNKNRKYYIWGNGPLYDDLHNKYCENISFMGYSSNINKIYESLDLVILTSKFENCPLAILESKARGIPCIAPNVGGISEIVKNGIDGYLYEEFNINEIFKYIDLINDNYQTFVNNCKSRSEMFDTKTIISKWEMLNKYF